MRLGVARAGIRKFAKDDLVLVELAPGTHTTAMFTRNAFRAAPIQISESHLGRNGSRVRYLLINTGNANAGTGAEGYAAAMACCDYVAAATGVTPDQILPFSTGVIGEQLPMDSITAALPDVFTDLSEANWPRSSSAILTTDTHPKLRSVRLKINEKNCVITGMAKGAGMICPNLATMLAFVGTDAAIAPELLERALRVAVDCSFNRITVDGDTSTNDAVVLSATGQSGLKLNEDSPEYEYFEQALVAMLIDLAQDIVRDGEGASKFVEILVSGGASDKECDRVARAVAHSPLVKTALFASDPNWGRILAVIGRVGLQKLDISRVSIAINSILIAEEGARAKSYTEEKGLEAMSPRDLKLEINLGRGLAEVNLWTTDLSYEYVKINADYRT